jgi:Skp family chaperone for outer membrane proteins
MVADLEAKKAGKLDLILTDETKSELSKIETSRTEIETDFNLQLKALDERLIEIQNAEVKKKQDDAKREADLKKKQDEILAKAREAEDTLKDKLTEVGNKAKESIVDGFESVIQKLKDITVENNIEVNVDEALSNISSTLQNLPTPPAPVVMIPPFPDPAPISVSVDVDTESLLTEQTGLDIKEILDGKFVNQ